jgi:hypothetical protein
VLTTRRERPQRYTARLEVHLDQAAQAQITRFVTAFRRRQSVVLRHVLDWGAQSRTRVDDRPPPATRSRPACLLAA